MAADADAPPVRSFLVSRPPRARALRLLAASMACALAGILPAVSLATEDVLGDTGGIELAPVESIPEAGTVTPAGPVAGDDAAQQTEEPVVVEDDLDGSLAELRALRSRLDAQREQLQGRLMRLEGEREQAEQRLERATEAIAARLVGLLDSGEDARLQALIVVRDATDVDARAALLAALAPQERALVVEHDAAQAAANAVGSEADIARRDVLALGTRVGAIDAAIGQRDAPTADERARARGSRYSFDADLVFATGPIPTIGYWGDVAGGSVLDGWMGYAGAAVGGVGCEPPAPSYVATGQIEQGEASWYGPGFHGNNTANGEVYDQRALTAAHKTLPFGTLVRVYSSVTARCVFVRINDRGPFIDGRIIDLSQAAAEQIGMSGVAPVQVEVWAAPGGASTPAG